MPKVSVIMATYNQAATLPRAIDSILAQTLTDFELIIVDDGSVDATRATLAEYARRDKRVRVIAQENQGLANSRNNGAALARGEYIAFMDSDDACAINRLAEQYNFLHKNPKYSACSLLRLADISQYSPGVRAEVTSDRAYRSFNISPILSRQSFTVLGPHAMLSRKSFAALGGYRTQDTIIEDLDFTLRYTQDNHWATLEGAGLYFYTSPAKNSDQGLVNKNILEFAKRHLACYISDWCRLSNTPDPVAANHSLADILDKLKIIPWYRKVPIYRDIYYMRGFIGDLTGMSKAESKNYLLSLLSDSWLQQRLIRYCHKKNIYIGAK